MTLRSFYECDRGHQTELTGPRQKSSTVVRCNTCGLDAHLTLIVAQHTAEDD
jgi:hypothetical protein